METKELKEVDWANKLYLLYENERWLNEQAVKGLIIKDFNQKVAHFEICEPQTITYKIMILKKKNAENQLKMIERQGFSLVESHDEYYIFSRLGKYDQIWLRLDDEGMLFTKSWFNKQITNRFARTLSAFIPLIFKLLAHGNQFIKGLVEIPTLWYVICVVLFIWLATNAVKDYRAIIKTKTCFMNHDKYIFQSDEKEPKYKKLIIAVFSILVGIALFKYLYIDSPQASIAEVKKTMPIVLLQDIEQEDKTEGNTSIYKEDDDSLAEINHTWLGVNQYNAQQYNEKSILYINYYKLRNNLLAEPLTKELAAFNIRNIKESKLKEKEYKGLDQVYIYIDENIQLISASKGCQVMCLYYVGEQPQEKLLNAMVKALN